MSIKGRVEEWIAGVAFKKGAEKVGMFAASFLAGYITKKTCGAGQEWCGAISVNPELLAGLIGSAVMGALEVVRNWAKFKLAAQKKD